MRWKAKSLICFWLSYVVWAQQIERPPKIAASQAVQTDFNRTTENMCKFAFFVLFCFLNNKASSLPCFSYSFYSFISSVIKPCVWQIVSPCTPRCESKPAVRRGGDSRPRTDAGPPRRCRSPWRRRRCWAACWCSARGPSGRCCPVRNTRQVTDDTGWHGK